MAKGELYITVTNRKTFWWLILKLSILTGILPKFLGIKPIFRMYVEGKKGDLVKLDFRTMEIHSDIKK